MNIRCWLEAARITWSLGIGHYLRPSERWLRLLKSELRGKSSPPAPGVETCEVFWQHSTQAVARNISSSLIKRWLNTKLMRVSKLGGHRIQSWPARREIEGLAKQHGMEGFLRFITWQRLLHLLPMLRFSSFQCSLLMSDTGLWDLLSQFSEPKGHGNAKVHS